jgi:hypothetical protein
MDYGGAIIDEVRGRVNDEKGLSHSPKELL